MQGISIKLNYAVIQRKIDMAVANSQNVKRLAYQKAYGIFYRAKRTMLAEFDRHMITQEILNGSRAVNISGTLDGYGNLFSFIGFHRDSHPVEELRELLLIATEFHQGPYKKNVWSFGVKLPTKAAIEKVTQMPWEPGNSWAFGVETYISGLSSYMYKRWMGSRSGMGFQLPYENQEDATFQGQPYITEILRNFRARINKI